ncbi:ABC transporter substrate-binding protein [Senegalia sp. (in: firmicutes)]|uniref:ABC transporter substrate-binding protein n=1 Tax=Senegalia sp. (in: firmicutes) TaxID=1924098 RepID=UPI003F95D6D4
MKKWSKVLSLSIVLLLVSTLFLGACSNDDGGSSDGSSDSDEKAEVNIFQFKVEVAEKLREAAKEFESENPNVKVNIETVGGGDDYGAALRAKFQSGQEPVIYNVGGPQDVEDWMDKLEDLSDQPWVDEALDGILAGATVEDKVYALPFAIEGYGFIYNTEIFEAAEIDASSIKDFASLESAVKDLDKKIKDGDLKENYPLLESVFSYPAKETWVSGLHTSNAAFGQQFDSALDSYNAEEVEFKYSDGLKSIIDLQADYSPYADSKGKLNAVDYATQVDEGISLERVAIIQQGNWVYGGIADIDEDVAGKLDILPMPIKGGVEDSIPVGVPMHWAINKNSSDADKEAAKDFLNWLYTSEKGKDYIVNEFLFLPPLKGYEELEAKDPLGQAVKKYSEEGKTIPWVFMGYPTGWGQEALGVEIQKYFAGDVTWEELVENTEVKWKEMR